MSPIEVHGDSGGSDGEGVSCSDLNQGLRSPVEDTNYPAQRPRVQHMHRLSTTKRSRRLRGDVRSRAVPPGFSRDSDGAIAREAKRPPPKREPLQRNFLTRNRIRLQETRRECPVRERREWMQDRLVQLRAPLTGLPARHQSMRGMRRQRTCVRRRPRP